MLAFTRTVGTSVIIGEDIEVQVTRIHKHKVKLAITAPRVVTVHRDEIWKSMNPGKPTPYQADKARRGLIPANTV
jgi:carbon storage regulator